MPPLKGQTVILVDDGIATGATFFASLGALLKAETTRVVAAVPVAPPQVVTELKTLVDETVVLHTTEWFFGIGQFYQRFPQVEDEEVIASGRWIGCLMCALRSTTPCCSFMRSI
jgi:putative phosphoribosyl transferase